MWTVAVGTALFLPQVFGSPLRLTTMALVGMVGMLVWTLFNAEATEAQRAQRF